MKKLMVTLAAAVIGISAQATQFNWSGSEVSNSDWDYVEGGTVYLFAAGYSLTGGETAADSSVVLNTIMSAVTDGTFIDANWSSKAIDSLTISADGAFMPTDPIPSVGGAIDKGSTVNLLAVIVDDVTRGDDTWAIVAGQKNNVTVNSTTGELLWNLGDLDSVTYNEGNEAWTIQGVPEPTSGLLLLLGMAGLALRRRRA